MEQLQLDPQTAQQYALFLKLADEDRDGHVGFNDASNFFSKSNLPKEVLAQIWGQARRPIALCCPSPCSPPRLNCSPHRVLPLPSRPLVNPLPESIY